MTQIKDNWRTTIAGIIVIMAGVYLYAIGKGAVEAGALIVTGIGLIKAQDTK